MTAKLKPGEQRSPVAFIDTETLGLNPVLHPIWEIAVIVPAAHLAPGVLEAVDQRKVHVAAVDTDSIGFSWQMWVDAARLRAADPESLKICRFQERYDPDRAMRRQEGLALVADLTAGHHLAGAVVSFDEERIRREMWQFGMVAPWHYHLIDVENLAVGYLAGCAEFDGGQWKSWHHPDELRPPWSSEDISRAIGIEPDEIDRHTALGDARWAKQIYDRVLGQPSAWSC